MRFVLAVLLGALLVFSLPAHAEETYRDSMRMFAWHDDWLKCQNDAQCAMIITPNCRLELAVNKDFIDEAGEYAAKKDVCPRQSVIRNSSGVKCHDNLCALVYPAEQD